MGTFEEASSDAYPFAFPFSVVSWTLSGMSPTFAMVCQTAPSKYLSVLSAVLK